jgi:hypothetical protein
MKDLSFSEMNNLIVRFKNEIHFEKDLILFRKHFPTHPLNVQLARANAFSRAKLDGQMLIELLKKITIEEILALREKNEVSAKPAVQKGKEKIADISEGTPYSSPIEKEKPEAPSTVEVSESIDKSDKKKEVSE